MIATWIIEDFLTQTSSFSGASLAIKKFVARIRKCQKIAKDFFVINKARAALVEKVYLID